MSSKGPKGPKHPSTLRAAFGCILFGPSWPILAHLGLFQGHRGAFALQAMYIHAHRGHRGPGTSLCRRIQESRVNARVEIEKADQLK